MEGDMEIFTATELGIKAAQDGAERWENPFARASQAKEFVEWREAYDAELRRAWTANG